jgi:hypothetical protein
MEKHVMGSKDVPQQKRQAKENPGWNFRIIGVGILVSSQTKSMSTSVNVDWVSADMDWAILPANNAPSWERANADWESVNVLLSTSTNVDWTRVDMDWATLPANNVNNWASANVE